jgi:Ca-activated chloride channel homolog
MESFRFANPEYLYLLLVIPAFAIIFWLARRGRRRALRRFGNPELLSGLMPNVSNARPVVKFWLWMLVLAFTIVGVARPQFGSKLKTVKRKGIQIMIALDVSNSMLAQDIKPDRLDRAKRAIAKLTDRLNQDQIGLIVFAGQAYIQLPITTDYESAKLFLNSVNTKMVPVQGTAIGAAINLAARSFSPNFEGNKTIIVITDGENHEDNPVAAAKAAYEKGITVNTIGMGLPEGAPIPVTLPNGQQGYRKDNKGNTIITKLDQKMLTEIADAGGGTYIRANNAQVGLNTLFDELNKMQKAEIESRVYSDYEDQYGYFLIMALALILIDFLVLDRKNRWLKNFSLFK